MEKNLLPLLREVGERYVKENDMDSIRRLATGVKEMMKDLTIVLARKGDVETMKHFSCWNLNSSTDVMREAVDANNIELCKALATERWRCNMMAVFASRRNNVKIVQLMLERGATEFYFMMKVAIENNNIDIVRLLRGKNIDDKHELVRLAKLLDRRDIIPLL